MVEMVAAGLPAGITGGGVRVMPVEAGRMWLVSGVDLAANTVVAGRHWLAPGRVRAVGGEVPEGALVSEVGDGYVVLDMTGARWREVLAMGTTISAAAVEVGMCAQTVFAGVRLLIAGRDGGVRLFVERPLAAWLLEWLRVAVTSLERDASG